AATGKKGSTVSANSRPGGWRLRGRFPEAHPRHRGGPGAGGRGARPPFGAGDPGAALAALPTLPGRPGPPAPARDASDRSRSSWLVPYYLNCAPERFRDRKTATALKGLVMGNLPMSIASSCASSDTP